MKSPTVVLAQHPLLSTTAGIASQHWIQGEICLQDKRNRYFLLNPIGWCMSSMIMTIMCVFIWLVEGWAILCSIMIMCPYITYIYIFFIQIYIFSLWMLMGLFEGWSYSSAGMMERKNMTRSRSNVFFAYFFTFEWILHKYCKLTSCIPESIAGAMKVSHLRSSKHIVKLLDTHQKWWDPWS